jgi:serine protease Do
MKKQELLIAAAVAAAFAFMLGLILAGAIAPNAARSSSDDKASFPHPGSSPLAGRDGASPSGPSGRSGLSGLVDFADIVGRVNPAVLNIIATGTDKVGLRSGSSSRNPFDFFGDSDRPDPHDGLELPRRGSGSGFFIDKDGYLLTNHHVIEDADRVEVTLIDSRTLRATVVGSDPETDLALLKVEEPGEYPAIPLGDSDTLRVGEWVCAIGNPLRLYDHTVTVGVVSYKGRVLWNPSFDSYIQTDAAINFGNSGGPLLNSRGEVVGINTAVSQQGQGIGFAIPINIAKDILAQLKERGVVSRGYLGVGLDDVDEEYQEQLGLPEARGAVVTRVTADSPADKAGVKRYDVIVAVDGNPIETGADLVRAISSSAPETPVEITVYREGKRLELRATLDERDPAGERPTEEPATPQPDSVDKLGLTVQPLTPSTLRRYGLPEDLEGVMVARVKPLSPAADEGVRRGDVISEINRRAITDPSGYRQAIEETGPGEVLLLYVVRSAEFSFIAKVRVEK